MNDDHSRHSDQMLYELRQEFKDFAVQVNDWQRNHDKTSVEWRESIDEKLTPIQEFIRDFSSVKRVAFGILAALGTLATAGIAIYKFLKAHWTP